LLEAEVAERRTRNRNYRLGQARFPSVKELDSFVFSDTPINEAQVRHLHEDGHGKEIMIRLIENMLVGQTPP